jgi:hypothetical protein
MEEVLIVLEGFILGTVLVMIGYFLGKQYSSKLNTIHSERIELKNKIIKERLDLIIKDRDMCVQYLINLDNKLVELERENRMLKFQRINN